MGDFLFALVTWETGVVSLSLSDRAFWSNPQKMCVGVYECKGGKDQAFYNPDPPPEDFPGAVCSSITQWGIPVVSTAACDYKQPCSSLSRRCARRSG
jgi:hypothetical protein